MLLKFPARIYICEGPENTIHRERPGDNPGARSDFVIFRITYYKSRNNKTYTSEQLWILKGLEHPEIHSQKFLQQHQPTDYQYILIHLG